MGTEAPTTDDAAQEEPEIWAWCLTCARWFFCEGWFDKHAPHPRCPVCFSEPTAIENRRARFPRVALDGPDGYV